MSCSFEGRRRIEIRLCWKGGCRGFPDDGEDVGLESTGGSEVIGGR
jgi:hypothetical protein